MRLQVTGRILLSQMDHLLQRAGKGVTTVKNKAGSKQQHQRQADSHKQVATLRNRSQQRGTADLTGDNPVPARQLLPRQQPGFTGVLKAEQPGGLSQQPLLYRLAPARLLALSVAVKQVGALFAARRTVQHKETAAVTEMARQHFVAHQRILCIDFYADK